MMETVVTWLDVVSACAAPPDPPPRSRLVHLRNAARPFRASSYGCSPVCRQAYTGSHSC